MIVLKNFNNVSEKLIEERVRPLEPGQQVHYIMLTGVVNTDPDEKERSKNPVFFAKWKIPTKDRIKDPYKEGQNKFVDIGVVKEFEGDKPTTFKRFTPGEGEYQFTGRFTLTGGINDDEELYQYLQICNYNEANPYRDTKVPALFKELDFVAISKAKTKKVSNLRDALNIVGELTPGEQKEIASSLNWNEHEEPAILEARLNELAETEPEVFLKHFNDPDTKTKSLIKRAMDKDIINYDTATHRMMWTKGGIVIAKLDRVEGQNHIDAFNDWIKTSKNGNNILDSIKKQVKLATAEAHAETVS